MLWQHRVHCQQRASPEKLGALRQSAPVSYVSSRLDLPWYPNCLISSIYSAQKLLSGRKTREPRVKGLRGMGIWFFLSSFSHKVHSFLSTRDKMFFLGMHHAKPKCFSLSHRCDSQTPAVTLISLCIYSHAAEISTTAHYLLCRVQQGPHRGGISLGEFVSTHFQHNEWVPE